MRDRFPGSPILSRMRLPRQAEGAVLSSWLVRTLARFGLLILALASPAPETSAGAAAPGKDDYLPDRAASRFVTVSPTGPARASVVVLTLGVAIKETGPRETVKHFGEVYAFSPAFFAVHRDEPTMIRFWNLQPDDLHDILLMGPNYEGLMKIALPPLRETSYVFTFHREGLFRFTCTVHQPEMSGQIVVLPPAREP
jgi:plastocyanin